MTIGVFDSGLGGLTVLRALRRRLPGQGFVYLSDNANAPYGVRGPAEITDLTRAAVERLFAEGCGLVILACNTASAVALRTLQETWLPHAAPKRRVLGVFVPMIEAVTGRPWGYDGPPTPPAGGLARLGLFATPATVESGAFTREIGFRAKGLDVAEIACPGLVDAIEHGEGARAARIAAAAAARLRARMPVPQAVVLGCTHYPLVEGAFRGALPAGTAIYSQAEITAESLADYLGRHPRFAGPGSGETRALTTGDPAATAGMARIFEAAELDFRPA